MLLYWNYIDPNVFSTANEFTNSGRFCPVNALNALTWQEATKAIVHLYLPWYAIILVNSAEKSDYGHCIWLPLLCHSTLIGSLVLQVSGWEAIKSTIFLLMI